MKTYLLLIALFIVSGFVSYGQGQVVTGKVFAFKDSPLTNVTIVSKKSKKEVLTDINGRFSIEVAKNDKLVFTGAGFEKHVQRVKTKKLPLARDSCQNLHWLSPNRISLNTIIKITPIQISGC